MNTFDSASWRQSLCLCPYASFRGWQKTLKTIGYPFCFLSFRCYGWHRGIPVPPTPTNPPPFPPAIITSPPLCFPSISIVYASLVLLGPYSIFNTCLTSPCNTRVVLLCHFSPISALAYFFPVRRTVEAAQTRVYYVGLGWVGLAFLGQWDTAGEKKKSLPSFCSLPCPTATCERLTRIML